MPQFVGKSVRLKIPPEIYEMIAEKMRQHNKRGSCYVTETFYKIFMTGLETLGADGVEKIITDIASRKRRRWKGGGGAHDK
jgi:hypothetical protein